MNRFDRIISYVAPEAGRRRAIARLRAKEIQKVEMRYDAAQGGRRTADWPAPASNADSALYGAARTLRQMSRDMLRNRPLAVRARDVVAGAVVGTGVLPSVNAPGLSQVQRDLVLQVISDHLMSTKLDSLRTSTLPQMQDIIMKAVFSDGEMLVRRRPRTPIYEPDLLVPFQIQLLEIDHLYPTTFDFGGNRVIDGVEYGPTGAIVAYHLLNEHPGALLYTSTWQVTRVPATDVLHIRRLERPEQLRGMPWLAPVMMTLGELSDYQEAQILKQRMAALVAGVLETDADQAQADTKALNELEPGAIVQAPGGSKITWTTPPKVDDYTPFMSTGIRAVATGLGITYESLSGDLTGVNYSSGRMGHMVMDRNVEMWQQNIVIGQLDLSRICAAPSARLGHLTFEGQGAFASQC